MPDTQMIPLASFFDALDSSANFIVRRFVQDEPGGKDELIRRKRPVIG